MTKRTKRLLALMAAKPKLRRVSGLPPLSYTAKKAGFLTDYRIYGQTSRNLFDGEIEQGSFNKANGALTNVTNRVRSSSNSFIYLKAGSYTIDAFGVTDAVCYVYSTQSTSDYVYSASVIDWVRLPLTFSLNNDYYCLFGFKKTDDSTIIPTDISNIMLNSGSTPLPYEPYGESVGDRTGNLFDGEVELGSWDINTQPCSKIDAYHVRIRNANFIKVAENSTYSVTMSAEENVRLLIHFLDAQRNYISETTWINNISNFNTPSQCEYINIIFKKGNNEAIALSDIFNIMLNAGSTPLPYEPYGYKVPVTVSNGTDTLTTPIYLPEQIKKVGDEAEYIDYGEQKQHRVRKNLFDYTTHRGNIYGYLWQNGNVDTTNPSWSISDYIPCTGTIFTINQIGGNDPAICLYDENKQYITGKNYNTGGATIKSAVTIESSTVASYIRFSYKLTGNDDQVDDLTKIMLNSGSEPLPYEPYIENTDLDVTLPALPTVTRTNVLSVGTEVQPSLVEVTGRIRPVPTGGGE